MQCKFCNGISSGSWTPKLSSEGSNDSNLGPWLHARVDLLGDTDSSYRIQLQHAVENIQLSALDERSLASPSVINKKINFPDFIENIVDKALVCACIQQVKLHNNMSIGILA